MAREGAYNTDRNKRLHYTKEEKTMDYRAAILRLLAQITDEKTLKRIFLYLNELAIHT